MMPSKGYRWGSLAFGLVALLLFVLPLARSVVAERVYGAAANCGGCVRWASLGSDAWLGGVGIALLGAALALRSRWLRTLLLVVAFALALAMLTDTVLLDLLSLRLHMADVLKFGGEGLAITDYAAALWHGGYWPPLLACAVILGIAGLILFPVPRAPRAGLVLAILAAVMVVSGGAVALSASGYTQTEGVVNIAQLHRMRGVNAAYSHEFAHKVLSRPVAPSTVCEPGQGHRPDIILIIYESLSAYHSSLLEGRGYVPELDRIAAANSWFSGFHANGFTTDQGMISLLDGRVPVPAVGRYLSLHAFDGFGDSGRSVIGVLRPAGYQTAFFTTATLGFLDHASWLERLKLDHFEGAESPYYRDMPRGAFDAAEDRALYGRVLEWMDREQDEGRPFFLAMLTVQSHPPFLAGESGVLDEAAVFRKTDHALGDFYRELEARGFFQNGILLVTGDHRAMTAVDRSEWERFGDRTLSRIPLVVAGASGLPKGRIDGDFQQTDLLPSLAQLTGVGEICRRQGQGIFLRAAPEPPGYVVHARGDQRGRVDIYYPDGSTGWIRLAGDASTSGGSHPLETAEVAAEIHRDRIERGEMPQDMAPLLLEYSKLRFGNK